MLLALLGAVLLFVSVFLSVADSRSFSRVSGNLMIEHGEGIPLLVFAVVIVVAVYRAHVSGGRTWVPVALGLWALGIAVYIGTNKDLLTVCSAFNAIDCETAGAG